MHEPVIQICIKNMNFSIICNILLMGMKLSFLHIHEVVLLMHINILATHHIALRTFHIKLEIRVFSNFARTNILKIANENSSSSNSFGMHKKYSTSAICKDNSISDRMENKH